MLAEQGRHAMARLIQNDGVHRRQVSGYLDFDQLLEPYRAALKNKRVDIETAVAIVGLGESARREVMRFVERGQPTDSVEVNRIADSWLERSKSDDESHYRDALRLLTERRLKAFRQEGLAFRKLAGKLHDLMADYADANTEAKKVIRVEIVATATELTDRFQREFGGEATPVEDWGTIDDPAQRMLAEADHALRVLAVGEFDEELPSIVPRRDFPIPLLYLGKYLRSWSAIESIRFLARRSGTSSKRYAKRPLDRLSAVDICAGIGSGALGLKSSGFFPSRLFDREANNVDSFLANRRNWNIRQLDINDAQAVEVEMKGVAQSIQGKQLDLMMGSLPTKPWRTNRPGVNYEAELHTSAMRMVGDYNPRAFFFEHTHGLVTEKHAEFYLPMTAFFAERGYHTTVFQMHYPEFGIPQHRTGYYLVGVQKEYADHLHHPIVRNPVTSTVAQVIEKLAFPHRTVEGYEEIKGEPDAQLKYNNWSSEWLRTHGQRLTGDVNGAHTNTNRAYWKERGFDLFPKIDAPIGVGKSPEQMLIPMTTAVIRALQGLPQKWAVHGETNREKIAMLCAVTPPVITAAVARSVHAALTGDQIDLDSEGALDINASPFLHHPAYVEEMGNPKGQLAALWRRGILTMRGELPLAMADDDPFLSEPPEDLHLRQRKIRIKKR
ncbi:DNA cytosine methyltransferase [Rhizobium leguminosarum]|uniref:DNA cytosine methyltransferase n=1 Tax=Rhizobium leguminosarum TaxID=384 RepID=UPI001442099F|nr:DNA cytosine methyltransferase [Rhizobium leguminosarum]